MVCLLTPNLPRGFPDSSVGKESVCNAGDPGLIPGLGRSPGEGKGYPLQYSGLENSMDYTVPLELLCLRSSKGFLKALCLGKTLCPVVSQQGHLP